MESSFDNPADEMLLNRSATDLQFLSPPEIEGIPQFKQLTDHLLSISKPDKLPDRKDVQPSQIKRLLPDLYILDVKRENNKNPDFILRLMGTNVVHFYGEHSGRSIHEMANKEAVKRINLCATKVLEEKQKVAVTVGALSTDQKHLQVSVLYCPLAKEDQIVNQIIGLVSVRSTVQ